MKYSNPIIPEGINTSQTHPLREFFLLTGGVIGIVAIAALVLGLLADRLAHHIPFEVEQTFANTRLLSETSSGPMQSYLDSLTQRIVAAQNLPSDITITMHYIDDDTVNAFATLGGHVYVFRGLLEKLPNENAVAMVLAHEIAHIKHRHPIRTLGRGITIGLALSMVSSSLGDAIVDRIVGNTGMLTALSFSRDQERESDDTALDTLMALYGNVAGADQLFEALQSTQGAPEMVEFFSTHPLSKNRLNRIHVFNNKLALSKTDTVITPLPADFDSWLSLKDETESGGSE
ncbi:MAG: M48 family metallopeptidase [Candidatus Thiodiazotropha sp.]|jgi:predicted Zn-dependent protease